MDDFEKGRDCGDMLYLRATDEIEHLVGIQDYYGDLFERLRRVNVG